MSVNRRLFLGILALAVAVKLALCAYVAALGPQAMVLVDSHTYLETARTLMTRGAFAHVLPDGTLNYEFLRTPGYPLFLGVFHHLLGLPLGAVIFIQVLMSLGAAYLTYKTALLIDTRLGAVSVLIMLYEMSVTVYSLMVLTESLYLLLVSAVVYSGVRYIKEKTPWWLILCALELAAATYVRPISYYLGFVMAAYFFAHALSRRERKGIVHVIVFLALVYALLGAWQWRNGQRGHPARFSSISGVIQDSFALWGSYQRNEDSKSRHLPPAAYYANAASRNLIEFLTLPGSLKYFDDGALKAAGKLLAYPFIAFWLIGLIAGTAKLGRDPGLGFIFLVFLYFAAASVGGSAWSVGARFRVPAMPEIAILSAYGWAHLAIFFRSYQRQTLQ